MQIALIALGSRGDVQPYIALGQGLRAAGHSVRLVTHANFLPLAAESGLEFQPVRGDVQEAAESPEMRALVEQGNFIKLLAKQSELSRGVAVLWAQDILAACTGVDLLIAGMGGVFSGIAVAEKLDLPLLQAYLVPFTPTAVFPGPLIPASTPRLGGKFNRLTHHLTRQMLWQSSRAADQIARREVLGLPTLPAFSGPYRSPRLAKLPILYGFSPTVIPPPGDWGRDTHVTGYWFLDPGAGWTPPLELDAFLQAGPPPVAIGFGSMGNRKPEETVDLVLHALERTGQRGILLSGWGGLGKSELPSNVYMTDSVPHAWLYPRVSAVVHHGGAGTTAAGLRAGVPTIVVPFFGDQSFWGDRVAALGAGPAPIPRAKLSVDTLAGAIQAVISDQGMRQQAASLGTAIRAENGVSNAVHIINKATA